MREEIAIIAGPRNWGDTRESWLARVPVRIEKLTAARLSFRMVKSAFYGTLDERHWAAFEIRKCVEIIEGQREFKKLLEQREAISQRLLVIDEAFHKPTIAQIVSSITELRGKNKP